MKHLQALEQIEHLGSGSWTLRIELGFGILFYGTTQCLLDGTDAYLWPIVFAQVGLVTFVFGKNGLLSTMSAVFVYSLALGIFTIDPTRPYFSGCMVNVVILLAVAVFAFVSAIGGWQRIFKSQRAGYP